MAVEFIDDVTPVNRANLMAVQGFQTSVAKITENSIEIEYATGEKMTVTFNDDGSVKETLKGEKTITKTTYFKDGTITEVLS